VICPQVSDRRLGERLVSARRVRMKTSRFTEKAKRQRCSKLLWKYKSLRLSRSASAEHDQSVDGDPPSVFTSRGLISASPTSANTAWASPENAAMSPPREVAVATDRGQALDLADHRESLGLVDQREPRRRILVDLGQHAT
jgi:hypothetical protein